MDYIRTYDAGKRKADEMKKKTGKKGRRPVNRKKIASPLGDHFTGVIALELETGGNGTVPVKKRK